MSKEARKELWSWIRFFAIVIFVSLFINRCIIVNAEVPTSSMENLIEPGDRLIGSRLAYITKNPERFDVVIFKYPVDESKNFIKRIIGLPGETVQITDGKIYINGSKEPLDEPYLKEEWTVCNDNFTFHVPEDSYLMLGDNRNVSLDARYWEEEALSNEVATAEDAEKYQYVARNKILGKAEFKDWSSFAWLNNKESKE